jgi:branched-chain amino acid transport system ATP-binding protein
MSETEPFLAVDDLVVAYGGARAVFGVSFTVAKGHTVAVLGANGAGKSSLAASIAGAVTPQRGSIQLDGTNITNWPPYRISRSGVAYVPEGRGIFPHLTVIDNLRAMLRSAVPREQRKAALARAFDIFPVLGQRRRQHAGTLSGGEQQMLSLARVLAAPPRLLVADEMSLGLAPRMVDVVFESLDVAKQEGVTIVLVEQYVERALAFADDAIVMRQGEIAWRGPAAEAHSEVVASYLGT